jgi:hypothetical protein
MTNPFKRGSAPDRARPDYARPGSFKTGHEKLGGRKLGTPNKISANHRKAVLEAAYRVGNDGNGKDGVLGYFLWVGRRFPEIIYTRLLVACLEMEANGSMPEEPRQSVEELNAWIRNYIGIADAKRTNRKTADSRSRAHSSGPDFEVDGLMRLAVEKPRVFCDLFIAVLARTPTKRRGPAA